MATSLITTARAEPRCSFIFPSHPFTHTPHTVQPEFSFPQHGAVEYSSLAAAMCSLCLTCLKALPSALPACCAICVSFLFFLFLFCTLYRQDSRHITNMKTIRPSIERMATVSGGSLYAGRRRMMGENQREKNALCDCCNLASHVGKAESSKM